MKLKLKRKLILRDVGGRTLEINEPLARIFGFRSLTFRPGEYVSEDYLDVDFYASIGKTDRLTFKYSRYKQEEIFISRPVSRKAADVTEALKKAAEMLPVGTLKITHYDTSKYHSEFFNATRSSTAASKGIQLLFWTARA